MKAALLFLFLLVTCFGTETWYVDPSAAGSTQDGTTTNPYLSLNGALAGKCNKTFTEPIQLRCRTSSSTADTVRASDSALNQMEPSAANYLEIIAETGHRASGSWNAAKYHLYPAYGVQAGTAMEVTKQYVRISGLQIGISTQTGTAEIFYAVVANVRMEGCLIRGLNDSGNTTRGLSLLDLKAWNTVVCNLGANVNTVAVQTHNNPSFYSCTLISGGSAVVNNAGGTVTAKNSYAGGASSACWNTEVGSTTNLTTCASSDTTGSIGLQNVAHSTATFVNVTAGSQDYHLPVGSALIGAGTDTSGDAAPFNFTTDMDGVTRTVPWDVGPLKYVTGGTGSVGLAGAASLSGSASIR